MLLRSEFQQGRTVTSRFFCFISILAIGIIVGGCSGAGRPHHKYIPKESDVVVRVKVRQLGMKSLSWKEMMSIGFWKNLMSGSPAGSGEGEVNLAESGVDWLNDVYVFSRTGDGDLPFYTGFSFALNDAGQFGSFVSKLDATGEVNKKNGIRWTHYRDHSGFIGWTGSNAVVLYTKGSTDEYFREHFLSLFALDEQNMLVNADERFRTFHQQQEGDIGVWINTADLEGLAGEENMQVPVSAFMEKTWFTAETWFEQGKIRTATRWHLNAFIGEQAKGFLKESVDADLVRAVAGDSAVGVAGLGINPSMANNAFQFLQMGMLPEGSPLSENKDALLNLLSGDLAVSLRQLIMPPVPDSADALEKARLKYLVPEPGILAGIGVEDASSVDRMLQFMADQKKVSEKDGHYLYERERDSLWLFPRNKRFFIANKASLGAFDNEKGPGKQFPAQYFTDNPVAYYINFDCLPQRFVRTVQEYGVLGHQLVPVFKSMQGYANIRKDSILEGSNQLFLKNDSLNSVKVLREAFKSKDKQPL